MYYNIMHGIILFLGAGVIIGGTIGAAVGLIIIISVIITATVLAVNKRYMQPEHGSLESGLESGQNVVSASTKNDKTQVAN